MTEPTPVEYYVREAAILATNCVLVVRNNQVVVVDAGVGVTEPITNLIAQHGWEPLALFITHGHVDHTWDAAPLSAALDVPVLVHEADRYYIDDPFGLDPRFPGRRDPSQMLRQLFESHGLDIEQFQSPERIQPFGSSEAAPTLQRVEAVWGDQFRWIHAPGHTPGATIYVFGDEHAQAEPALACTGDVLFHRGVGRTDLPGGNSATMTATLRHLQTDIAPATVLIPGHGPYTTMVDELSFNPYFPR